VDQIEDLAPCLECVRVSFPYSFQAWGAFTNFVKKERGCLLLHIFSCEVRVLLDL
jgi:hypothetical protein